MDDGRKEQGAELVLAWQTVCQLLWYLLCPGTASPPPSTSDPPQRPNRTTFGQGPHSTTVPASPLV